uniref:Solute carrier organic anion transporter family member n=1 Tax=Astyanax mexicanus TaxID=7994 RepID=A0A8B9RAZ5_ASTMX
MECLLLLNVYQIIISLSCSFSLYFCMCMFQLFLFAMSFIYFAKAFQGSYMKSSVVQIERRFDIPSSLIGFIDGSFEIGNLLIIAFVSYFGAKLHRPRLIGVGCLVMAVSSFITALPHFFQGPYKYATTIAHFSEGNTTETILPCLGNTTHPQGEEPTSPENQKECEQVAGSSLWVYVFLGNMLRGIGETPVMPLGLSYLDDFAREENTALYLACIQTVGILGPMFGYMLGSFCAKLYVDIGRVDLDTIAIDHKDTRWVGAWWLGFLVTGTVMLVAGIPFWFLPRSLPKQGEEEKKSCDDQEGEQDMFITTDSTSSPAPDKQEPVTMSALAKDFLPSLRKLFSDVIYVLIILTGLVQVNGFIGMITFKPKYMEQTYGQSASKAIFLIGGLLSQCNSGCSCSLKHWDPVCSNNGLTYASPCLAGCQSSTGQGKEMVFHNCSCVEESLMPAANMSVVLGQCPRTADCDHMFKIYMAVSVLGAYISACGATPGYMILLRSIHPDLKSLALGMQTLIVRTLGAIPPPIYFGALIDKTCLKWGVKRCGGRGACRLYDADAFRATFLGLIYGLYTLSYLLCGLVYNRLSHRHKQQTVEKQAKEAEQEGKGTVNGDKNGPTAIIKCKEDLDKETTI